MTPPRSELRPPLPGGARALGRPGGGAATRATLASLGEVV